ncbi:E1-E2 ATPase-domain-containing protein [Chaetomium fimeti]|uniref:E1-E2 ATPase-domain-containing protein n=1 Tax=Chaetomium fimeti TaxID=1854472 RepID=A0AAE0HEN9_9PEZI|nr:E1-E2 ATPase-domain-containing protein [Chaetomium fimeti]
MACGSGCCGQPVPAPSHQADSDPVPTLTPMQDDRDSCCDDVNLGTDKNPEQLGAVSAARDESTEEEDCCAPEPSLPDSDCNKGCCSTQAPPRSDGTAVPSCCEVKSTRDEPTKEGGCCAPKPTEEDDCCAPKPTPPDADCKKGCCSAPAPARSDDTAASGCCEGKAAPCCDQSCLDRLALRECEKYTPSLTTRSSTVSTCGRGKDRKPCVDHANKARLTYAETLAALGCICRALVALGQESCCLPPPSSSARSIRRCSRETPSFSRVSVDSCCAASGVDAAGCSAKRRPGSKKGRRRSGSTDAEPGPRKAAGVCADSCCDEKRPAGRVSGAVEVCADEEDGADVERAFTKNEKEHVILSISGMTCTGCETKLVRTLGTHPAVKNLKTSLVLSRAEFDVVGAASVVEVMKHLERTTEFKCERVTNKGSNLDLIAPGGDAAAFVDRPWPGGVTEVRVADKKTVNVSFDGKVIGARDLVNHGWDDGPIDLAPPRPDLTLEAGSKHVRHMGYMTLLSACLTIPVLVMAWAPLPERKIEYGSASLALATVVQFAIAGPFYPKALKSFIFSRIIEMDFLIVLSTSAAYIFSVVSFGYLVSGQPLSTGEFFETSTLLVTLIMVGRWVGALARQKAVESISIRSLQTSTALLVNDDGETEIDARLLQYGDVFKVVPESRIPTDGTVVSGSSEVNESMITGESRPVEKHAKSPVIAGSVNGSGVLLVRLTRLPGDNTISTIAGMVDEAKLSKPKIQDLADRVAGYFVPAVVALTIITFVIWIAIGVAVRQQPGKEATIEAITYAIAVLIVSCPCAIGLAVPMVIVIASGVAAERGVIFKSAESIEVAYKTSHVVLDKTGTITEGKLSVSREWYARSDQNTAKSLLLGLVGSIKHPVSAAVATHLKGQGVSPSPVSQPKTLTGKGVEGTAKGSGSLLRAGNSRWLNLGSDPEVQLTLSQGYTVFCFTIAGSIAAVFGLEDSIRPDAASTVKTLIESGISVHIISGDDDGAVRSVGAQLNVPETNIRSRLPLQTTPPPPKRKKPVVIFCGDGTNDAVALAQATIGVHMNEGGTDVASSAADVVLMRPNLAGILTTIAVSRKSIRRIAFNFGWSFVYNLFAVLLAAGAFVRARIPPEFAGLGELVSVLPVIAAAMLLRWSEI